MRKSLYKENIDYIATEVTTPTTHEAAEAKLEAIKSERKSRMHKVTKYTAQCVATAAVEGTVINTTFTIGNAISEGLTGESLHGVGLALTTATALTLGVGAGVRTYCTVGDAIDMVDDYRERQAKREMYSLDGLTFSEETDI